MSNYKPTESHQDITLEYSKNDPTNVEAIFFDENNTRYYFSNELGHKIISGSVKRPMTKKEYKESLDKLIKKAASTQNRDQILDEIINLDFGLGHANSTFEITKPLLSDSDQTILILNQGISRYLYSPNANTVFHIDRSKHINGSFIDGSEKNNVVQILTHSKTIQRKMLRAN